MAQNIKKLLFPASIAIICLVAGWFLFYFYQANAELGPQAAAEKAISFINENFLSEGNVASLVNVTEEGTVYKIVLDIGGQEYTSFTSKDGKFIFPEGYPMDTQSQEEEETTEVAKSDKPVVDLYVMSFCPYGNLAENTMLPVYNLLKDKVAWNMHYIVNADGDTISSLHGQPEVDQDKREACVLKNSGLDNWFKFTTFVNDNCGDDGSCWEEAATEAGLNKQEISSCVSSNGLDILKSEATVSSDAGVSGSPTMIINGTKSDAVYQYGKPQSYLDAICSAFNAAPGECAQTISDQSDSTASGSCN
jgi:hypothetical protein